MSMSPYELLIKKAKAEKAKQEETARKELKHNSRMAEVEARIAAIRRDEHAQKRLHELPQEIEEKEGQEDVIAQYMFKDGASGLLENIRLLNIAISIAEQPIIEKIFLDLATRPDYMNPHKWCREPTVDLSYNEIIATFETINRMHHGLVYVKKIGGIFGAFATPEFRLSPDGMEVARLLRDRKK